MVEIDLILIEFEAGVVEFEAVVVELEAVVVVSEVEHMAHFLHVIFIYRKVSQTDIVWDKYSFFNVYNNFLNVLCCVHISTECAHQHRMCTFRDS